MAQPTRAAASAHDSPTARGYGHLHQQHRRRIAPTVNAGLVDCSRCGYRIQPGEHWDLDHSDDRRGYVGVAHRSCNRAAGARKGNALRNGVYPWSREWHDDPEVGTFMHGRSSPDTVDVYQGDGVWLTRPDEAMA